MTREEKNKTIDQLAESLNSYPSFYLTDASALTVENTNKLRKLCFDMNVTVKVVKNTLLRKAFEKAEKNYEELYDSLKGNTTIMFTEVGNVPAKVIRDFRKKQEKPLIKAAFIEEAIYIGDEQLKSLAELKSKEELVGEIIGLLQSPIKNVISGLKSSGDKLARLVEALPGKEEGATAASAPTKEDTSAAEEKKEETPAEENAKAEAKEDQPEASANADESAETPPTKAEDKGEEESKD